MFQENVKAWFMRQGLWDIVSGRVVKPVPVNDKNSTLAEQEKVLSYEEKAAKVAGELNLLVSQKQKVHLAGITDDVAAIIRKMPDESLTFLMTRVDTAMEKIKNLYPKDFAIDEMDNELIYMTLIRALPEKYSSFAFSLQLIDKFSKEKLQEAFVAEELRTHH
ncbi:hypothetical protein NM688_g1595 [Phlebia brevispora]|uniref:Uncharacterized protein n=1 Tax=Phlebia brevispora TaxID=194682 RepID=A0ACC1TB91_9APHY|nr:hypothetical protein NM688_g1595 [Phlebia brevispora]